MTEPLLTMRGIVKDFDGVKALDGIDLTVRPGECVGLCGENGAGKSTLMKVLSGVHPHGTWDGEIHWEGAPLVASGVRDTERAGIVIIHQELMLVPELSVAENIFLGNEITLPGGRMHYAAMVRRAHELLRELRIDAINVARPVMDYGGGHQQLIEIAKALNKRAKLLILDEPSSSLTAAETQGLLDIVRDLKRRGVACVYISHKLEEVEAVCDTVTVIRDGRHVATEPMRALSTERIIAMMVGREIRNLYPREPHEIGDVVLEARNVTCHDVTNPRRKRVDDVRVGRRRVFARVVVREAEQEPRLRLVRRALAQRLRNRAGERVAMSLVQQLDPLREPARRGRIGAMRGVECGMRALGLSGEPVETRALDPRACARGRRGERRLQRGRRFVEAAEQAQPVRAAGERVGGGGLGRAPCVDRGGGGDQFAARELRLDIGETIGMGGHARSTFSRA